MCLLLPIVLLRLLNNPGGCGNNSSVIPWFYLAPVQTAMVDLARSLSHVIFPRRYCIPNILAQTSTMVILKQRRASRKHIDRQARRCLRKISRGFEVCVVAVSVPLTPQSNSTVCFCSHCSFSFYTHSTNSISSKSTGNYYVTMQRGKRQSSRGE